MFLFLFFLIQFYSHFYIFIFNLWVKLLLRPVSRPIFIERHWSCWSLTLYCTTYKGGDSTQYFLFDHARYLKPWSHEDVKNKEEYFINIYFVYFHSINSFNIARFNGTRQNRLYCAQSKMTLVKKSYLKLELRLISYITKF